ncbi:MAG: cytochrome c-type biogenesis protein CcmH [Gemmatimonadales bacterium]
MQSRRRFVVTLAGASASVVVGRRARAMQVNTGAANAPMEQEAYKAVTVSPKPGAAPSMTDEKRDALEHELKCQCGCVLDVYTCRTTDFSCGVSPAMHHDVMNLVSGGYTAPEILAAFQKVYGEQVLMSPLKEGFNWVGYLMPFAALITGGVVVAGLIRKWAAREAAQPHTAAVHVNATQAELDAVHAAMKDDA